MVDSWLSTKFGQRQRTMLCDISPTETVEQSLKTETSQIHNIVLSFYHSGQLCRIYNVVGDSVRFPL